MLSVSHPIIQRAAFAYQHVVEENKNDMVQKPHLMVEKEQNNTHWHHYVMHWMVKLGMNYIYKLMLPSSDHASIHSHLTVEKLGTISNTHMIAHDAAFHSLTLASIPQKYIAAVTTGQTSTLQQNLRDDVSRKMLTLQRYPQSRF